MSIPQETRKEAQMNAYAELSLHDKVYRAICENPPGATSTGIAWYLGDIVLNIRPRLTELQQEGKIKAIGKYRQKGRRCSETIWAPVNTQMELL